MSGHFAAGAGMLAALSALAALAWLGVAALEWRRYAGRRRAVRRLLLAAVCGALLLLAARPRHLATRRGGEVVLLTTGATPADIGAATVGGRRAFAVPAGAGEPALPAGATALPDAAALLRLHPETLGLRVFGHGLAAWELAELPLPVVAVPPPPLPFGVARIDWSRRLALGEALEVSGLATGVPPGGATVRLAGAAIAESATRLAAGSSPFRLRVTPRGPGHHLLALRLEAPGRSAVVESIDAEVVATPPPAVLWLEAAPSTEGREVKRWLAESGGALAWRARLSRGIERDEVVGLPPLPHGPLTLPLLRRFDLVVADRRALAGLGAAETAALATAVRESGVGLLMRAGDDATPAALGVDFPLRPLPGGELAARLPGPTGGSAPLALPAREIAPATALVPLVEDREGRLLAAWRPEGSGAVGLTLVDGTWRWVLSGHAADHRRFWRQVITAMARPVGANPGWQPPRGPLLVGRPVTLTREGDVGPGIPRATVRTPRNGTLHLSPRQDAAEADRWTTTWWPRDSGWHRLGDEPAWVWVTPAERWSTWRLAGRQDATATRALAPPPSRATVTTVGAPEPLPRWPLFLLFVLALAALWADEQLGAAPGGQRQVTSDQTTEAALASRQSTPPMR